MRRDLMSIINHPGANGQIERVNAIVNGISR